MIKNERTVLKRGEVYWAELPIIKGSSIQTGERPIILSSNKESLRFSPVIQYIPVTSELKKTNLPVHIMLETKCPYLDSMALVEQEGLIDKFRLKEKICDLTEKEMAMIDLAIIRQRDIDFNVLTKYINEAKHFTRV